MKNLKFTLKITLLCLFISVSTLIHAAVVVSNGGTYYICQGSTLIFECDAPSGDFIPADGSGYSTYWTWGGSKCSTIPQSFGGWTINSFSAISSCSGANYTAYQASVTCNTSSSITVTVQPLICSSNNNASLVTFTIVPYSTSISGPTSFCESSNQTYTCNTNVPGVVSGDYNWTPLPSFLSGSSTNSTITVTPSGTGTGTMTVTVSSSSGCPTGSASNSASLAIASDPSTIAAPTSLSYRQDGGSCEFNATVPAVTYAQYYDWSQSSTFSYPYLYETTTTSITTEGEFDASTQYTIYVRARNGCASNYASFTKTTPAPPPGCKAAPMKPNKLMGVDISIYPNPANASFNVKLSDVGNGVKITVVNLEGEIVKQLTSTDAEFNIQTSDLPEGMYFVRFVTDNYNEVRKVVIAK